MKDFFKRVKADAIMSAVLCIALGVVLIVWPGETINIVCKVLAAGLIILGGVELFSYITNRNGYMFTGILGLIVLIVGLASSKMTRYTLLDDRLVVRRPFRSFKVRLLTKPIRQL